MTLCCPHSLNLVTDGKCLFCALWLCRIFCPVAPMYPSPTRSPFSPLSGHFPLCFLFPGPCPPSHHFPSGSWCCVINAPFDRAHNLMIIPSSGDAGAMQPANVSQRASVPNPSSWQGWNPNSPAAPLLVAASPGTFIFLFSSPRILRVPPQWSIDRRSGGCDPYKGSQRWDTRKGALYGVIECLADGNRGDLNGVLCCHLEREWQGQVWAIWKKHFVRCNHASAAAWRAPAARKKYQMTHTPIFSQCSDLGSESHTAHYDSCFVSWKLGLLLSRL